jgi:sigma-E factor negative regulatory protein RseA
MSEFGRAAVPPNPEERDDADPVLAAWSAFLDGELDAQRATRLMNELRGDEDARSRWALWHAVGDALRSSEVAAWHSEKFCARVVDALASEPTVLAPVSRARSRVVRRYLLPGAAIAAAAGMLAVVAVPQLRESATPSAQTAAASSAAAIPASARADAPQVLTNAQIERYFAAHRELVRGSVLPGAAPLRQASSVVPVEQRSADAK